MLDRPQQQKKTFLLNRLNEQKDEAISCGYRAAQDEQIGFTHEDFLSLESGNRPDWFTDWYPLYFDRFLKGIDAALVQKLEQRTDFRFEDSFVDGILAYWDEIKDRV